MSLHHFFRDHPFSVLCTSCQPQLHALLLVRQSPSGLLYFPIPVLAMSVLLCLEPSLVHSQHFLLTSAPHTASSSAVSWWASRSNRASTGSLYFLHPEFLCRFLLCRSLSGHVFIVASCTTLFGTRTLSLTAHSHKRCCHSRTIVDSISSSLAHTSIAYHSTTSSCTSSCCIPRRFPITITISRTLSI